MTIIYTHVQFKIDWATPCGEKCLHVVVVHMSPVMEEDTRPEWTLY